MQAAFSDVPDAEIEEQAAKALAEVRKENPRKARGLALLREEATVSPITTTVSGKGIHPEDDLILAITVSGNVPYLITGGKQLQKLDGLERVTALSPAELGGLSYVLYFTQPPSQAG